MVITWNANSTPVIAQDVLRQIAYSNTSNNPSTAPRTIDFVLTDGDGGASNTVQQTVNVTNVNAAPVLDNSKDLTLTTISEDDDGDRETHDGRSTDILTRTGNGWR